MKKGRRGIREEEEETGVTIISEENTNNMTENTGCKKVKKLGKVNFFRLSQT